MAVQVEIHQIVLVVEAEVLVQLESQELILVQDMVGLGRILLIL
jgi:hypothetical protein